jgi:uncharacterized DUF497 family protein
MVFEWNELKSAANFVKHGHRDKIRLISVRRARDGEAKAYFQKIQSKSSHEDL